MGNTSSSSSTTVTMQDCSSFCSSLSLGGVTEFSASTISCTPYKANDNVAITGGQADVGCGTTFTTTVDICRVVIEVTTSYASSTHMEVWLPNTDSTSWNQRTMSTDNGGMNGCVHYVDMAYVASKGFAAIGDNAGHNSSSFDGTWTLNNNERIVDWAYRARHAATRIGKSVTQQFYNTAPKKAYYVGCSAGGAQGLQSAQRYPEDFDGIIAGSPAADYNHLQDWSSRFVQLTGTSASDAKFLTLQQWLDVQTEVLSQCDKAIDGVDDGILEDPTQCIFDSSKLTSLTATQINTVNEVFSALYNTQGELIFPALLPGSQYDAYKLGMLSGAVQGIAQDWFRGGVYNNSNFDVTQAGQADYDKADSLNELHGDVAGWSADLTGFRDAGKKMIIYHGLADPLVSGINSQRYYLKVAASQNAKNTDLDAFLRLFRISGMAHCGVGGISGAGAWQFGQNRAASSAENNIIDNLVDWVENGAAPDTLLGTKFWYDTPSMGVQLSRAHCRFPYRTTYSGSGDVNLASSWGCTFIDDWQTCGPGASPRLCNVDGSFN